MSDNNNLILTLNPSAPPKHLRDHQLPTEFETIVQESSRTIFQPLKRSTASLVASGIMKGIILNEIN